jgi:hypothetical protein
VTAGLVLDRPTQALLGAILLTILLVANLAFAHSH